MIRLFIVLLIILGTMYMLLIRETDDGKQQLKYQENLNQAKDLEQQVLKDAKELEQKIDDMTK